jgi:hypothetical protein
VAQVQLILTQDPQAPNGIPPSFTKLMGGRVCLFGDFEPATAADSPGRVYIETDPAQLAATGKKNYKLVGWLVQIDKTPGDATSPPAGGAAASRANGATSQPAAPTPGVAAPRASSTPGVALAAPTLEIVPGSAHAGGEAASATAAATSEQGQRSKRRRVQP